MDLSHVLSGPSLNHNVDSDWRDFETEFNVALPSSYKDFISAYGPCVINDTLTLFHPRAPEADDSLSLRWKVSVVAAAYGEMDPSLVPYRIFPAPGGIFPVGHTTWGHEVFLRPRAHLSIDGWAVLVDWDGTWLDYQICFRDFLERALTGDIHFFHESVLDEPSSYELVGRVL
ncbi:SMI1/KNR4 family protein [Embleya sp. NBC_00896]|uniref:SMI1/KNR4 family protein n=1 Tax=Embleya sp. NBC_00896 TaxID=2975961 RepID=UPI003868EA0F|nr:SMI1/KNR4 family protein [Embleya sp. NBC_00896]